MSASYQLSLSGFPPEYRGRRQLHVDEEDKVVKFPLLVPITDTGFWCMLAGLDDYVMKSYKMEERKDKCVMTKAERGQ